MTNLAETEYIERIRVQTTLAERLLAALMLVNGGAIIGLFTFLGNAATKDAALRLDTAALWWGFAAFIIGVLAALTAFACAFLSQHHYTLACHYQIEGRAEQERTEIIAGGKIYAAGIIAAIGSVASFGAGAFLSLMGVLPA
ncbi:hypothetical protein [Sphingobium baderi]|uniref:MotA/TolQ/ExbB proton channel domain-containing protein n=1 Tax=Sphingobium baderi LL03 TaxID=1114964 RepID=T0GA31_9SPHN|nr:hypothetical protein [Sphingobium baderi]EQA96857.1 hypothetical protein L485_22515 [Sphingobium baderi LL03]KMS64131.1 hypothetical protein V475_20285 [Sphingobium baderi LL03]